MPVARHQAGTAVASIEEIRAHFPAPERRHNGWPVAYFDGPGGTQALRVLYNRAGSFEAH
ncbi:MAG: hypothetical protein ABSB82_09805 [Terriglobia bacterium]